MSNPSPPPSCNDGLILSWFVRASNCWLEMVLGQKIRMIILRFLVWNAEILERFFSVILQHSELNNKVERTQLMYNLSLVLMLYFVDFHTLFIILNVFLALLSRPLMSLHGCLLKRLILFNFLPLPFLFFEHNECVESARPKNTFATCHLATPSSPVGGGAEPINCLCTL